MPPPWQSDQTRRSRQIALVIAVSLTSLLVAIAGFSWFVKSWRNRESANQVVKPPIETLAAEPNDPPVSAGIIEEASSETAKQEPTPGPGMPGPGMPGDLTGMPGPGLNPPPVPDATEIGVAEPATDSANVGDPSIIPGTTERPLAATSAPADLIPRSPLDPMPGDVPAPPSPQVPSGSATASPLDSPDEGPIGAQDLPPELAKYTKFLLEEGSNDRPTLEAPPTMDDVTIEAAADELDDPTITVRRKQVNLKADLAMKMALATKGYPLPDLALLIGQITGVPIQLDWVSFDLAGVDLNQPLATPQGWQTAREILRSVTEGLGAEVRDEETLVSISLTDEAFAQQLASIADLNDFGDQQGSANEVLIDFLRGEGEEAGKEPSLGVSRDIQQISAIAIEALRRMRGIQPKVTDQRIHRWAHCSNDPTGEWTPLTGGEAGPQQDTPITMADFLRRMAKRNGVANLVNWYDFGRRGVAPEHLLLPHAEADAAKTLDRVLRPLGLQARQVDPNHWWIGRESTYDRLPVIVWTPPLGESSDRFVEELSKVMEGASRDAFRITVDPQSGRALLLLPRFVVRQLDKLADGVAVQ